MLIHSDGTNWLQLTENSETEQQPAWSPDGTQIVFTSYRDGAAEIYVMDVDGSNQVNLTNNPKNDSQPAWSPNGKQIAFVSDRDGSPAIYVMGADGSKPHRLTDQNGLEVSQPKWSPDGEKIAFISTYWSRSRGYTPYYNNLWVMNSDGSAESRLLSEEQPNRDFYGFNWSPNSRNIAFGYSGSLCTISTTGTNLTCRANSGYYPDWSPSGDRIIFSYGDDVVIYNVEKDEATQITDDTYSDVYPIWSPDGQKIAFISQRDGKWQLIIMNPDGSGQEALSSASYDRPPAWAPAPPPP